MKEESFVCRDARITTRDLEYRNQTWSVSGSGSSTVAMSHKPHSLKSSSISSSRLIQAGKVGSRWHSISLWSLYFQLLGKYFLKQNGLLRRARPYQSSTIQHYRIPLARIFYFQLMTTLTALTTTTIVASACEHLHLIEVGAKPQRGSLTPLHTY